MNAQDHPDALAIEGVKSQHWFLRGELWHAVVFDSFTGQEYDVRQTPFGWNVNDDNGRDYHRHVFEDAIQAARGAYDEAVERKREMDEEAQEALRRLAMGDMLVLTIPRDDFAVLMDTIARCEQGQKLTIDDQMVSELSRIASDLSQQADGQ